MSGPRSLVAPSTFPQSQRPVCHSLPGRYDRSDRFELELDERFEEEFDELFEEELELEFEELLDDELELELLEELELELDELLPATMISPSVRPIWAVCVEVRSTPGNKGAYSLASAAEPTNAARPAAIALFVQFFVISSTPCENRTGSSVRRSNGRCAPLFHDRNF
ncbi:hypothetical protein GOC57_13165 [Sinorhizobium meliloti]|nr:hypothetical protein [Sinorhizobium meliloti]MDW9493700.1 hypothetical protein [Sinorhizobium meliloti]MDW9561804.1 hypothetical protein [Sinorhizobium meliloti]MDW9649348.1 hypothetical protein [Sinorhizobium meliloti]MDW9859927.1 hypothetical protein [Sinorhizobium meliloti]